MLGIHFTCMTIFQRIVPGEGVECCVVADDVKVFVNAG
jgi:hypothetical protein